MLMGRRDDLKGDAHAMAVRWGFCEPFDPNAPPGSELFVDALFAAGLSRPLEGDVKEAVRLLNASDMPVLSIDMPSGIAGDSGPDRWVGDLASPALHAIVILFARDAPERDRCERQHRA